MIETICSVVTSPGYVDDKGFEDYATHRINEQLGKQVMDFAAKGVIVVNAHPFVAKQIEKYGMDATEYRRYVDVQDLVLCGECALKTTCQISKSDIWFCGDGFRADIIYPAKREED